MKASVLKDKSYAFAIEIIKTYKMVSVQKKEFVLSKQLLRSGTSVGANIREAEFAQSKMDFIHKLSISLKEANESIYWLSLLKDTDFLKNEKFISLKNLNEELIKMLVASINTLKSKL